jgi:tRNA modification GTPase
VGKSSLINGLLGYRRAIVYEQAGTTRDAVTATTALDGWPAELIDTAGLRASRDEVERAGVELARQRIEQADLVIFVSDASQPWCRDDDALAESLSDPLVVHNKCDLPPAGGRPQGLATSALTKEGLDELIAAIGRRLVPNPPERLAAVPFTQRQVGLLTGALHALNKGEARHAARLLEALV